MKDFIKRIWKWVRIDGLLHFLASAVTLLTIVSAVQLFFAILLTIAVGVAKEIYDEKTGNGTPEAHDLICDFAGMLYGIFIYLALIL